MTRFRVSWNGTVRKTVSVETTADALYHIWSRHREEMRPGVIEVFFDEDGHGRRPAQISFPVRIVREIEDENPADAVCTFLGDDRLPGVVQAEDIKIESAEGDPSLPSSPEAV